MSRDVGVSWRAQRRSEGSHAIDAGARSIVWFVPKDVGLREERKAVRWAAFDGTQQCFVILT